MSKSIDLEKLAADVAFAVAWIKGEEERRKRDMLEIQRLLTERRGRRGGEKGAGSFETMLRPQLMVIAGSARRRTKPRGKLHLVS